MTSKPHKKHAALTKPQGGRFHRQELSLIGAPCGKIQTLAHQINQQLKGEYNIGFVDAEHQAAEPEMPGMFTHYIDKIDFHQLNLHTKKEEYQYRSWFNDCDLVLVNGNHFLAERQLVFLNTKKKASLERKLDRLTNVLAFIQDDEEVADYLKEKLPQWSTIPIFSINDEKGIAAFVKDQVKTSTLKGLVLAGGKSERMGKDKGALEYYGIPQREFMAQTLNTFCAETYLSVAPGKELESEFDLVVDSFIGLGPFGGILSAFRKDPNAAWMVVACDQPLLNEANLRILLEQRDTSQLATCFHNPETKFPEPLITIWEPRAYPVLLQFLAQGYSCPRKVLINSRVKEITLSDTAFMTNVNTPKEYEEVLKKMGK